MTDWTEKHRPSTLSEVRGNDTARDELHEWAKTWDDHRKAVIVHGDPGVGKTSAAHALANDMGWPTIELNASDSRTADDIDRLAGRAAMNATLGGTSERQLVVVDEADNFHGNVDRGGAAAVTRLVKESEQPIVLIANEFYDMSNWLRNACETIEFRNVSSRSIAPVLRDICRQEGIEYESEALDAIAEKNSGDLRSAINDLQALAETSEVLSADDVVTGDRDRSSSIFEFMDALFKEEDAPGARRASFEVDETPDDLINWIEDNVHKDYSGEELATAYDFLGNADRWLGRVRATQNYSYWRYAGDNMTAGVAAARSEPKGGWTRYGPPSYWRKLGRSKGNRNKRDYVARKIADSGGVSMSTARREIIPFLAAMTHHCKNRELTVTMAARYDLDAEHVAWITGSGESTNKVQSIVEDAEERKEEAAVEHSGGAFDGGDWDDDGTDGSDDGDDEDGEEEDDATGTLAAFEDSDDDSGASDGDGGDEDGDGVPKEEKAAEDEDQSGLNDFF
jgi:replication factor C large subunit